MTSPYPFNGAVITFEQAPYGGVTPTAYPLYATSWQTAGGDRPEVDITSIASTERESIPGMTAHSTITLECLFQASGIAHPPNNGADTPAEFKARLDLWTKDCAAGTLVIEVPTDCETDPGPTMLEFYSTPVWVSGITYGGSMDEAYTFSITFIIQ